MRGLTIIGLLGPAAVVLAHPHAHKTGIRRRTVDLNAFRLAATAEYVNATSVDKNPPILSSADPVSTATELVVKVVPGAEFRMVESYVGNNGVVHVYFKQTAHGLDVDNADFNVNVSSLSLPLSIPCIC